MTEKHLSCKRLVAKVQEECTGQGKIRKEMSFLPDVFIDCEACNGQRFNEETLNIRYNEKNIFDVFCMTVEEAVPFFHAFPKITRPLKILDDIGMGYITLGQASNTLSGGEAQRIRLATQIGAGLSGVLYVLDEPSIGLHQRDNDRLLATLLKLRDLGNTLIVVEHDEDTIRAADHIVDIGPGAGVHGGHIVSEGGLEALLSAEDSLTGAYLSGRRAIPTPAERRSTGSRKLTLVGCERNNLSGFDVDFPLGRLVCVTGVSGSGKSTMVNELLHPALEHKLGLKVPFPTGVQELKGITAIDKVIVIDQSPIGRTPRSNPATYTGAFDPIRQVFAATVEAKARGYQVGQFSFNVKGGRCEEIGRAHV